MKLFPITFAMSLSVSTMSLADTITITVQTASSDGVVSAGLYDSAASFEANTVVEGIRTPAQNGATTVVFKNVAVGTYGVAVFHDANGNEKLDRNLLGAPVEPFGFSKDPKIGFSAPSFDSFAFEFDGSPLEMTVVFNGE